MTDEPPVPETLESIAASIRELRTSMESRFGDVDNRFIGIDNRFAGIDNRLDKIDNRFDKIDSRFVGIDNRLDKSDDRFDQIDRHFDEMKAQLRTEIESVRGDVKLVAEGLAAQTILLERIDRGHRRLEERVDTHDLRILALEPTKPA